MEPTRFVIARLERRIAQHEELLRVTKSIEPDPALPPEHADALRRHRDRLAENYQKVILADQVELEAARLAPVIPRMRVKTVEISFADRVAPALVFQRKRLSELPPGAERDALVVEMARVESELAASEKISS